jgi:hypothetical protein
MARLPSGYTWIARLGDQAAPGQEIPVLRPAQADRAERWAAVLHHYPPTTPRPPAPPGAQVASLPGDEHLGAFVAQALGRPHHPLASHSFDEPGALGPAGGSLLLVAPARRLTLSVLMPLMSALARQDTTAGFLTGRDVPAVTFAAAKVLAKLPPETDTPCSGLLDGTTGLARILTADRPDDRVPLAPMLTGSWSSLLVDADGSGSHAALGVVTLCGRTGATELTLDGVPLPGGCTSGRCKTDPSGRIRPVPPHTLRARVLALFVCNAITLGEEQYPSDLSLALDALEGFPEAVLGLLRGDLDTSSTEPRLLAAALHSGARFGHCAALLNTDASHRGIRGPSLVLLGDPEQHLHASRAAPAVRPRPRPADAAGPAVQDLQYWQRRLADAEAFEHGLHASLARRPDGGLVDCLTEMAAHRASAVTALHSALRSDAPADEWKHQLDELSLLWAHTVLSILSRTRGGAFARQLTASRAHHRTVRWSPAPQCPYCGAPREYQHLTSPLGLTDLRTLRCPKCGPALSLPASLQPLQISAPAGLTPGKGTEVAVDLPPGSAGLLAFHLRPRTTRRGPYDHVVLAAVPGRRTAALAVPEQVVAELDRLWAVHAYHFHLAYHQLRLPVLPTERDTAPRA